MPPTSEREYSYVGPAAILERVAGAPPGVVVASADDAVRWLDGRRTREEIVTYTVGTDGSLRVADRRSEHVACAGFGPILAAGEMTLARTRTGAEVVAVSNQSTGYCPEPSCWPAVARALDAAGLAHPGAFTVAYEFRRCPACGAIHLVKDGDLTCACGAPLPAAWNFAD